jgi:large subunit ribosomal protein L10
VGYFNARENKHIFSNKLENMAITRQKKEEIVEKVRGIAADAKTIVFANFRGLTVAEQSEMRKGLRSQGVGYTVAKKTLLRRALGEQAYEGEIPMLEGEIALAYSADELAPAREIATYVKKFPEHLQFAGGIFGGKYMNTSEIKSIAAIPGMDTLRAQFVFMINSPLQRLAIVLNEAAKKQES